SEVLSLAVVEGAVYGSVNGSGGGYTPYLIKPAVSPSSSKDAAGATAAYRVRLAVVASVEDAAPAPPAGPEGRRPSPPRGRRWPPSTTRRSPQSRAGRRRRAGSPPVRSPPRRCSR